MDHYRIISDLPPAPEVTRAERNAMTGYDSYLSSLPAKPEYARHEYHGSKPLYPWLEEMGAELKTERSPKIFCTGDGPGCWARAYDRDDGSIIEVRQGLWGTVYIIIEPQQVAAYKRYEPPMPYWLYSMG